MTSSPKRAQSNYALRLPASLKKAAEQTARADGATLNQFIVTAVAEKLSALRTADYFASRAARADEAAFDRIMSRRGGTPPASEDVIPPDLKAKLPPR
jgi:uncharacterized protein (DUF1778 family)